MFYKEGFPKNFAEFTEKHYVAVSFLITLQASVLQLYEKGDSQLYEKGDSDTGAFLWIFTKNPVFIEHLLVTAPVLKKIIEVN